MIRARLLQMAPLLRGPFAPKAERENTTTARNGKDGTFEARWEGLTTEEKKKTYFHPLDIRRLLFFSPHPKWM